MHQRELSHVNDLSFLINNRLLDVSPTVNQRSPHSYRNLAKTLDRLAPVGLALAIFCNLYTKI